MKAFAGNADQQASAIESKQGLLAYLRSGPQQLSIESYLCLTRILGKAGWRFDAQSWNKDMLCLPALEAAIVELEQQIAADRDRLLSQTVKSYAARLNE